MYKTARKEAGLSIEEAAFRLHVGMRTLQNYEGGQSMAPPDVVLKMSKVYGLPALSARYCSETCPIGQKYANPVKLKDLACAVLGLTSKIMRLKEANANLIDIAEDGVIEKHEVPTFERVLETLLDIEQEIETLKLQAASIFPVEEMIMRRKNKKALGFVAENNAIYG